MGMIDVLGLLLFYLILRLVHRKTEKKDRSDED